MQSAVRSGRVPGPMEAYLALRGLRTLPLRLAQAQATAQILAERLVTHRVRAPGTVPRTSRQILVTMSLGARCRALAR